MSIFLIAQTPRAGEKNHCLVIPCDLPISEREVFQRINAAIEQAEGKDYIAVSQVVEQTATTRQGREMLVLVGLNVSQLTPKQRHKILLQLKYYLAQFERLVTQQIDWQNQSCPLLVCRPELNEWGEEIFFNQILSKRIRWLAKLLKWKATDYQKPSAKKPLHQADSKKKAKSKYKLFFIFIIIILIGVGLFNLKKCTTFQKWPFMIQTDEIKFSFNNND
jgi:hypothetical protein